MALNLAVLLTESAAQSANHAALIMGMQRLTYGQLNAASNKVANALRSLGVQRGDRVALMLPNVMQFPIVYYGILKLGATVVPLNVSCTSAEVRSLLQDSDAIALFVWEEYAGEALKVCAAASACRHPIIVNGNGSDTLPDGALSYDAMLAVGSSSFDMVWTMPDDTAVIVYAPEASGPPLGAELTHANMFFSAVTLADRQLQLDRKTVGLAALPLVDPFGQTCAMNALVYAGGTIRLAPRFDGASALAAIQGDGITLFAATQAMLASLLEAAPANPVSLAPQPAAAVYRQPTGCVCLGSPIDTALREAFEQRLGIPIIEGYGRAETSAVVTLNPVGPMHALPVQATHASAPQQPRAGSAGRAIWGTEVRLIGGDGRAVAMGSTGEVVVRGHNVMKGYYKRPEATADALRDGWLHTGDSGRLDEDRYLYIVARRS